MMTNVPQTSKVDIRFHVDWHVGIDEPKFKQASTSLVIGKRFSGKSTVVEALATKYLNEGGTVFDIFSARDSESLAWLRSPYKDALLVCGDTVRLKTDHSWVRMGDFNLKEAEQHELVLTAPAFYSTDYEMYASLSRLVDHLKWRTTWQKVDVLLVREARRLLTSRIMSGRVKTALQAEYDFIELHDEAYHTGVACLLDSLRPFSIDVSVRDITNYLYIKKIGKMQIPRELWYLMRKLQPSFIRQMRVQDFILLTDNNAIGTGYLQEVPWHVKRGEDLLSRVGIEVEKDITKAQLMEMKTDKPKKQGKVNDDMHKKIIFLREAGKSYRQIRDAEEMKEVKLSPLTIGEQVKDHELKRCVCF